MTSYQLIQYYNSYWSRMCDLFSYAHQYEFYGVPFYTWFYEWSDRIYSNLTDWKTFYARYCPYYD